MHYHAHIQSMLVNLGIRTLLTENRFAFMPYDTEEVEGGSEQIKMGNTESMKRKCQDKNLRGLLVIP